MAEQRPPRDLNDRELPWDSHVPSELYRVYREGNTSLHFGTGTGFRFNDPDLKYGVCYLAYEPAGAFAGTILRDRAGAYFDEAELVDRLLAMTRTRELLRLVQFYGNGLSKLGTNAVSSSGPYTLSQQWPAALHNHPSQPDGLAYRAPHDNDQVAVALFERTKDKIKVVQTLALTDPRLPEPLVVRYELKL